MKILGRSYAKLMIKLTTTSQVSYENVKFAANYVIRGNSLMEAVIGRIL